MKAVYVLMHQRKPNAKELADAVVSAMHHAGMLAYAEEWLYDLVKAEPHSFDGKETGFCEAILAVGGDGTLLRANALALQLGLPVLGVNVGRVGFLTEVEMEQLGYACQKLASDEYSIDERMMLCASVEDVSALALNDVVISRGGYSRLIGVDAWVENDQIGHYVGDGLIVSTPTGSTGYSLSAGGPIICPDVSCMLLTPICAHSLQHRPVVTSADQAITIRLNDDVHAMISVDGRDAIPFRIGQVLTISKAEKPARFIRLEPKSFFSKIRIKLSEWSC